MNEKSKWVVKAVLAALVAPLVPGAIVALPDLLGSSHWMALWYVCFSAVAGYVAIAIIGLPLFVLTVKRGMRLGLSTCALIGGAAGIGVFFFSFLPGFIADGGRNFFDQSLISVLPLLPFAMIAGLLSGGVFWLIARPNAQEWLNKKS